MRIFLTGATGHIGAAVLDALVRAGHEVTALVRDNEKARLVATRGAHPVVGSLAEPDSFGGAAEAQDGYILTAFDSASGKGPAIDRAVLQATIAAAKRPRTAGNTTPAKRPRKAGRASATTRRRTEGDATATKRFIIYTSDVWILGRTPEPAAEDAPLNPISLVSWRPDHEALVLRAANEHVRTVVIRPGVVYGGGSGRVGDIFKAATNGLVRVVGDGNNHWPLVYDRDLADLYARLAAREDAAGVYHANDEGDERVNDIVAAIGPYLPLRPDVRHVPLDEARTKIGAIAEALALDQLVRSPRARALGWTPTLRSVGSNAARLLGEWRAREN